MNSKPRKKKKIYCFSHTLCSTNNTMIMWMIILAISFRSLTKVSGLRMRYSQTVIAHTLLIIKICMTHSYLVVTCLRSTMYYNPPTNIHISFYIAFCDFKVNFIVKFPNFVSMIKWAGNTVTTLVPKVSGVRFRWMAPHHCHHRCPPLDLTLYYFKIVLQHCLFR
jgi:hypothetical protein